MMKFKGLYRIILKKREKFRFILEFLGKIIPARILIKILRVKFAISEFFVFKNKKLKYFCHSYNNARTSERTIEIPIIRYFIEKTRIRVFLEIGNVTNHYYTYFQELIDSKVVVDKYEKGWGVINLDIKDYLPKKKWDFIYSISTFEHMDSDGGKNPDYVKGKSTYESYAADNIVYVCHNLLNTGGLFIITAPLAVRSEWDHTLFSNKVFDKEVLKVKSIKIYFFRKINELNWRETDLTDAKRAKYNYPLPEVNILSVIVILK